MSLTLRDSEQVVEGAQASAAKKGLEVSIAVVDRRGDLVISVRLDGARAFTSDVARGKAMASAILRKPSVLLGDFGASPIGEKLNRMHLDQLVFYQGAIPLEKGGDIVGAVGVSGATPEEDEEIAAAGASRLSSG